jgi:hypothetical protein
MIQCKSEQFTIKHIEPTKDSFLSKCSVGDLIMFIVPIKRAGSNRGRTYSSYITVFNLTRSFSSPYSFNQIDNMLKKVELEKNYGQSN